MFCRLCGRQADRKALHHGHRQAQGVAGSFAGCGFVAVAATVSAKVPVKRLGQ